jgi:hypothetical protein
VETDRGVLVHRNGDGHYLVIIPDADEVSFRTVYRFVPSRGRGSEFAVRGPMKLHQSLRFSPSDWADAAGPLPAQVQRFVDNPPAPYRS